LGFHGVSPLHELVLLVTQIPSVLHAWFAPQVPQLPPHVSPPHCLPLHAGTHGGTHWLLGLQVSPVPHVPQLPPQPSFPHCFSAQLGVHDGTQVPFTSSQMFPELHVPQVPPQPSGPHCLPPHDGVQVVLVHGVPGAQGCPEPATPLWVSGSAF
jgi:hypothetical protein